MLNDKELDDRQLVDEMVIAIERIPWDYRATMRVVGVLDITGNKITNEGIEWLMDFIVLNKIHVTSLRIARNTFCTVRSSTNKAFRALVSHFQCGYAGSGLATFYYQELGMCKELMWRIIEFVWGAKTCPTLIIEVQNVERPLALGHLQVVFLLAIEKRNLQIAWSELDDGVTIAGIADESAIQAIRKRALSRMPDSHLIVVLVAHKRQPHDVPVPDSDSDDLDENLAYTSNLVRDVPLEGRP